MEGRGAHGHFRHEGQLRESETERRQAAREAVTRRRAAVPLLALRRGHHLRSAGSVHVSPRALWLFCTLRITRTAASGFLCCGLE